MCTSIWQHLVLVLVLLCGWAAAGFVEEALAGGSSPSILAVTVNPNATTTGECFVFDPDANEPAPVCGVLAACPCTALKHSVVSASLLLRVSESSNGTLTSLPVSMWSNETAFEVVDVPWRAYTSAVLQLAAGIYVGSENQEVAIDGQSISIVADPRQPALLSGVGAGSASSLIHVTNTSNCTLSGFYVGDYANLDAIISVESAQVVIVDLELSLINGTSTTVAVSASHEARLGIRGLVVLNSQLKAVIEVGMDDGSAQLDAVGLVVHRCTVEKVLYVGVHEDMVLSNVTLEAVQVEEGSQRNVVVFKLYDRPVAAVLDNWTVRSVVMLARAFIVLEGWQQLSSLPVIRCNNWVVENVPSAASMFLYSHNVASEWTNLQMREVQADVIFGIDEGLLQVQESLFFEVTCQAGITLQSRTRFSMADTVVADFQSTKGFLFARTDEGELDEVSIDIADSFFLGVTGPAVAAVAAHIVIHDTEFQGMADGALSISSSDRLSPAIVMDCTFNVTEVAASVIYSDGFLWMKRCTFVARNAPSALVLGRRLPAATVGPRTVTIEDSTFERICVIASVSELILRGCSFDSSLSATFVGGGAAHPVNSLYLTGNMVHCEISDCAFRNANTASVRDPSASQATPSALQVFPSSTIRLNVTDTAFEDNLAYRGGAIVAENTELALLRTNFSRNLAGSGGAISTEGGNTTMTDVIFDSNNSLQDGGSIWVGFGSLLSGERVLFRNSTAHSAGGALYYNTNAGGSLKDSSFLGCSSLTGGAVVATGHSRPDFTRCSFLGCTCTSSGGAISVQDYSEASFSNCTVKGNQASSYGAGIHVAAFSQPTFSHCVIASNESPNSGGGAYVQDEAVPAFFACQFSNNTAQSVGAGMMFAVNASGTVEDCIVEHNVALSKGGGVALEDFSHPLFLRSRIVSNRATSAGGVLAMDSAGPEFRYCSIAYNRVLSTGGGVLATDFSRLVFTNGTYISNESKYASGGAVAASGFAAITLEDSLFKDNSATGGGALFHASLISPVIRNCSFEANAATATGGGAILLVSTARANVSACTFDSNVASNGVGGAVHCTSSQEFSLIDSTLTANVATSNGGAVYMGASSVLAMERTTMAGNEADGSGGALYVAQGAIGHIDDSVLMGNMANSGKGGAAFVASTALRLSQVAFLANSATYGGGVLQQPPVVLDNYVTHFDRCVFEDNVSLTSGGAIAIEINVQLGEGNSTQVPPPPQDVEMFRHIGWQTEWPEWAGQHAMVDSFVAERKENNTAVTSTYRSCVFSNNTAKQNGGAVYMDIQTQASHFLSPAFYGNSASRFGGAVFIRAGLPVAAVSEGTFTNNTAGWGGSNVGFRVVQDATSVAQAVCSDCQLSVPPDAGGYQNSQGYATLPSLIAYAYNTSCPSTITLDSAPFPIVLGLRDSFATRVTGELLEDQAYLVALSFEGTNCTLVNPSVGLQALSSTTGVATFSNVTLEGKNNGTCGLMFSSLTADGEHLVLEEESLHSECLVALAGCKQGEEVVEGTGRDTCVAVDDHSPDANVLGIMIIVILLLLAVVCLLVLLNVLLQYRDHKKRTKDAYYSSLEVDDQITLPNTVTLFDVLNDPDIQRIPFEEITMGKRIGYGASGVVSAALWEHDDEVQDVAMKELMFHVSDLDEAAIQEFLVEIKLMSALRHPNVVAFLGVTYHEDTLYLVTELMQYGNLRDLMTKKGKNLSWKLKMKLAIDAAKGMRYLHGKKLIHRDLKPQNLLVSNCWVCKVADFGISTIKTGTRTMTAIGTPVYMAPEVLNSERYCEKADVYSFGILLVEVFTDTKPYAQLRGMNDAQLLYKIYHEKLRPDLDALPQLLRQLVAEATQHEPELRPSFEELVLRLKRLKRLESGATDSEISDMEGIAVDLPTDWDMASDAEAFYAGSLGGDGGLYGTNGSVNFV